MNDELDYGTYDIVFTDAASSSVIYDIADYAIQQPLVSVKFNATRRDIASSVEAPHAESTVQKFVATLKAFCWGNRAEIYETKKF